jgi:propionyl-CoA synthetase
MFTAPTAFRAIRASDPEGKFRTKYDLSSLQLFFIAGERSDPSTVEWCQKIFHHRVPVIDNYWQTETGAPICSATRNGIDQLPSVLVGSCGVPVPGWNIRFSAGGDLVAKLPLPPGCLTCLWKRPTDMTLIYLSQKQTDGEILYSTFDVGQQDSNGFVHVMSRSDDVLNVAAHRLSTGQLEQALGACSFTAESAVVGRPCDLKGQRPVAFVVLKDGTLSMSLNEEERKQEIKRLEKELNDKLRSDVGPIATSEIIIVPKLPKTRSGKVLRKLLREMVAGVERKNLSISPTIEDLSNVDVLFEIVMKHLGK